MAYDTVINATHLAIAGVTGDLATLLSGKTVAQAAEEVEAILAAVLAKGVAAGGVVRYALDGQSVETSIEQLLSARDALRAMKRETAGPIMLAVEFGA